MKAQQLRNNATDAERLLWRGLSASKLDGFKFSRQIPVGPFICDFVCRAEKLVVELDGRHHDSLQQEDATRERYITAQGFSVLRFSNKDVFDNVEGVLMAIRAALPTPSPSREREGST
jgi:very-short-patch-repair endonuclease